MPQNARYVFLFQVRVPQKHAKVDLDSLGQCSVVIAAMCHKIHLCYWLYRGSCMTNILTGIFPVKLYFPNSFIFLCLICYHQLADEFVVPLCTRSSICHDEYMILSKNEIILMLTQRDEAKVSQRSVFRGF